MNKNVLSTLVEKHPDRRVVIVVSSEHMEPKTVVDAVKGVLHGAEIFDVYVAKGGCWHFVIAEDTEMTKTLTEREIEKTVAGACLPAITFSSASMVMYIMAVRDLITMETMIDTEAAWSHRITNAASGNTKIQIPGVDLIPIAFGHSMASAITPEDNPITILAKCTMMPLLLRQGINEFPKGFTQEIGKSFVIAPHQSNTNLFDISFINRDKDDEEFLGISVEQMFALYESRAINTIQ